MSPADPTDAKKAERARKQASFTSAMMAAIPTQSWAEYKKTLAVACEKAGFAYVCQEFFLLLQNTIVSVLINPCIQDSEYYTWKEAYEQQHGSKSLE